MLLVPLLRIASKFTLCACWYRSAGPVSQALPTRQKRPSLRRASGQLQFGEAADGIKDVGVHDVELFGDD